MRDYTIAFFSTLRQEDDGLVHVRVQVELVPFGQTLHERQHHAGNVHLAQVELVAQDEREQQVERAFERVEVQLELTHGRRHEQNLA